MKLELSWIPLFPLIGFLINGAWYLFGQTGVGQKKASASVTGGIATLAIFLSFLTSLYFFIFFYQSSGASGGQVLSQVLFNWMTVGNLNLNFAFTLDSLSTLFTLVITGVGTLIHLYSIGYMGHDESPGKFFAYLNLFCFAMLILVLGSSLPILFVGWEGVGLCSYLLIGFWYTDDEKAIAGKKAFVVNRIGDLGFILGAFVLFSQFGTLDFIELKDKVAAGGFDLGMITLACIFLFVGCTGKSAQIPLFVWLPDAMAGPTPVSALIHAATMVTSGIYLVARLNFMYSLSDSALHLMAWVGALTAFFAATIAIVQTDIKKVLAYSTVSQLGYMFLGCGVGAYTAGVFHVITHAFFKALLFLGAGSVIYGMHHEQDILKMGGLRKYMPQTFFVFLIGWLAICGIPPFSGFFSKDEILWLAFSSHHGSVALWAVGAVTAVMTAFYMTRLFSLTFLGKGRFDSHHHHPHESPAVMVIPLIILAVLSASAGFMGIPHMSWLEHWLAPVIPPHEPTGNPMEWILMGASVMGAVIGIGVALKLYGNLTVPEGLKLKYPKLHLLLTEKWRIDEAYFAAIVNPLVNASRALWNSIDVGIIDRVIMSFGKASEWSGQTLRMSQSGLVQVYGIVFIIGLVLTVGYLIYGTL